MVKICHSLLLGILCLSCGLGEPWLSPCIILQFLYIFVLVRRPYQWNPPNQGTPPPRDGFRIKKRLRTPELFCYSTNLMIGLVLHTARVTYT